MTPVVGNRGMQPTVRIALNTHKCDQLTIFTLIYACFVVAVTSTRVVRNTPSRRPGHSAVVEYHKPHIAWVPIVPLESIDRNSHTNVYEEARKPAARHVKANLEESARFQELGI